MATCRTSARSNVTALQRRMARLRMSQAERETRVNLAACYRLVAHYGMTDQIYNHISARLPEQHDAFLINAYGMLFEEVTASSLVKIDADGTVLEDATGLGINPAGFVIHSAVHAARPDAACVIHTHSRAGMAVSAQKDGLLPLTQHAMRFWNRIAYHDYEGIALDIGERARLAGDLGDRDAMILRNHGLLTLGATIRQAFELTYYLERACQAQIDAMAGGARLNLPPPEVCERTAQLFERPNRPALTRDWPALLRMLDRSDDSYRN
ncbi:MAG: class II aldolase/adducin family protein [Alphaproteobacteria bacterium]|nr:class II aldolase/adducin family protein [Alphaproteobacteria bacterium]